MTPDEFPEPLVTPEGLREANRKLLAEVDNLHAALTLAYKLHLAEFERLNATLTWRTQHARRVTEQLIAAAKVLGPLLRMLHTKATGGNGGYGQWDAATVALKCRSLLRMLEPFEGAGGPAHPPDPPTTLAPGGESI